MNDFVTANVPSERERDAFYGAALIGLRALDARERTPRRFGADADARWAQFAGALGVGDRVDLLLRDAAGVWGAAFSPAECFGAFGLADDEPFGPDWRTVDDLAVKRFMAEAEVPASLERLGFLLGARGTSVPLPALTPSTKLIVAGGVAILSVAQAFREDSTLSWTDQVAVVADKPEWRQLAGLAAVVLAARGRTVLVRPTEGAESSLRAAGFGHVDAAVISPDTEPDASALARKIGGL